MIIYIYIASVLFAGISSVTHFKRLDIPSKILSILICCAFFNECAARYLAIKYHNNLSLYAIYSIVEFAMLCLYFNSVIDVFIKNKIAIDVGVIGIVLGILNLTFLQHFESLNSFFLLFEGLSLIGMCLFAFFRMLLKYDSLKLYVYPHFWFISIILFFWCITFLTWGLYEYINLRLHGSILTIDTALTIVGITTYISLGCVFLLYPKMQKINE